MSGRPVLRLGDRGEAVAELQQLLIESGFGVGIDGVRRVFGRETLEAVVEFQGGHVDSQGEPLEPDGIVGTRSWWALDNPRGLAQGCAAAEPPSGADRARGSRLGVAALQIAMRDYGAGVREEPMGSNRGPRIDQMTGLVGQPAKRKGPPWCAFAVSSWLRGGWAALSLPSTKPPLPRIGGAQSLVRWASDRGMAFLPGARPAAVGDVFVIARDDLHGHCGMVRAVGDGLIWTIEGNCGNAVGIRRRKLASITRLARFDEAVILGGEPVA